jgi:hypothetical protein
MAPGPSETNTALLVQVLDHLGAVRQDIGEMKAQLEHGTRRFDAIGLQIDELEARQTATEAAITPLTLECVTCPVSCFCFYFYSRLRLTQGTIVTITMRGSHGAGYS